MIIFDCSVIIAWNPRFESPINVRGSKTYLSDRSRIWVGKKAKKIISKGRILPHENAHFSTFLEICKTGDFNRGISPWKRRLQKKRSIPWRRQRKMQENCHLRFLIFELSSQRFFDLKFAIFRFFKNSKKRKYWRFWPPNCGLFLNTSIKVNRWKTLLVPCTSKLVLSIFFVGAFVLAQFWEIASRAILFRSYLHENRVHNQSLGVQNIPLRQAKKMGGKTNEKNHF